MPDRDRVPVRGSPRDQELRAVHSQERAGSRTLKILISAGEASSDAHGAELLRALRELASRKGVTVEAFGVGGPKLQGEGLRAVVDTRELLAMGFAEVVGHLPRILGALNRLSEAAEKERPDLAVVIDYPDFHIRLARKLKAQGIPVVYYIPPKVWAWRRKRVQDLRELFSRILCILPFEEKFYRDENVPATYVGNPLVDELPLRLSREEARSRLKLNPHDQVLVIMPGSRAAELKYHLDVMLDAATLAAAKLRAEGKLGPREQLKVLIPHSESTSLEEARVRVRGWLKRSGGERVELGSSKSFILDVQVSQGDAGECLAAADAGLIKSGTSTLEAGLMGCPHAVVYKPSRITEWIFKLFVRYPGPVGLVNLVDGGYEPGKPLLAKEILMDQVTTQNLADEIIALLTDEAYRARLKDGLARLRAKVTDGVDSPSRLAAEAVLREIPGAK